MNYLSYKEAFSALVQENDGILPDLYEFINITISCHPISAPALTTVADVVAYALIETSTEIQAEAVVQQSTILVPTTALVSSRFVCLESLLDQAIASYN